MAKTYSLCYLHCRRERERDREGGGGWGVGGVSWFNNRDTASLHLVESRTTATTSKDLQ